MEYDEIFEMYDNDFESFKEELRKGNLSKFLGDPDVMNTMINVLMEKDDKFGDLMKEPNFTKMLNAEHISTIDFLIYDLFILDADKTNASNLGVHFLDFCLKNPDFINSINKKVSSTLVSLIKVITTKGSGPKGLSTEKPRGYEKLLDYCIENDLFRKIDLSGSQIKEIMSCAMNENINKLVSHIAAEEEMLRKMTPREIRSLLWEEKIANDHKTVNNKRYDILLKVLEFKLLKDEKKYDNMSKTEKEIFKIQFSKENILDRAILEMQHNNKDTLLKVLEYGDFSPKVLEESRMKHPMISELYDSYFAKNPHKLMPPTFVERAVNGLTEQVTSVTNNVIFAASLWQAGKNIFNYVSDIYYSSNSEKLSQEEFIQFIKETNDSIDLLTEEINEMLAKETNQAERDNLLEMLLDLGNSCDHIERISERYNELKLISSEHANNFHITEYIKDKINAELTSVKNLIEAKKNMLGKSINAERCDESPEFAVDEFHELIDEFSNREELPANKDDEYSELIDEYLEQHLDGSRTRNIAVKENPLNPSSLISAQEINQSSKNLQQSNTNKNLPGK